MFQSFIVTSFSGWVAALLIAATIPLPYLIRRRYGERPPLVGAYRARMLSHAWIGFLILAISVLHMSASMTPAMMRGANATGITLATVAIVVVLLQVAIGLRFATVAPAQQPIVRRFHLGAMALIVMLVAGHALINSPLLGRLLP